MSIYETGRYTVQAHERPHVDRDDGGHVVISPREFRLDRQALSPAEAIELMRLTIVVGEAMTKVMNERGVDIGRINYQDNGNWSVHLPSGAPLHVHLYGRAKSATRQQWGEALYLPKRADHPGFYATLEPLTEADRVAIREEIERLMSQDRYDDETWCIRTS